MKSKTRSSTPGSARTGGRFGAGGNAFPVSRRFTTYEHIEEIPIMIVKKDGRREEFRREKVRSGMQRACEKRNISMDQIEEFIDNMERDLRETGKKEIPSRRVGEMIMEALHKIDDVAYVRFASVYREFKDVNDFVSELKTLLTNDKQK